LPGFGFTTVSEKRAYTYSFDALAHTVEAFTDALGLTSFAIYVFDYGAPTGFRLAMRYPERVTAIISQNGNAYEEGLGDVWEPIRTYWSAPTNQNRDVLRQNILTPEGTRWQYTRGVTNPESIAPESYTLDAALLERPGNKDIQLDLFLDYASNVKLIPNFRSTSAIRSLLCWPSGARTTHSSFPPERKHSERIFRTRRSGTWIRAILPSRRTW